MARSISNLLKTSLVASALAMSACAGFERPVDHGETRDALIQGAQNTAPIGVTASGEHVYADDMSGSPQPVVRDSIPGTGVTFGGRAYRAEASISYDGKGVDLVFDNAPIAQVIDSVIGKILGAEFVIDPSVQGTVTLRSAGPVPRADIPETLNRALNLSGVALIETGDNQFTVVPSSQARQFARTPRLASVPGATANGVVIKPMNFVSAQEMARILQPFTPQGATVQIDSAREILIISGTPSQLDVMLETIDMFDVDWLSQMSFGVYQTTYVEPEALVAEIQKIYGGASSPIGTQVEFVPLSRLGAVLVIAKRPESLPQAQSWIDRLDISSGGEGRVFQFLPVLNADAEAIADTVTDLLSETETFSAQDNFAGPRGQTSTVDSGGISRRSGADVPKIKADVGTNSLIIYATDQEFRQIRDLVKNIDILPDQVLIEATIAEVTLNDEVRYGVQWFFDTRDDATLTFSDVSSGAVTSRFPGFSYAFNGNYAQVALNALASVTDVEVVSSPQIITLDNQPATLQVGDQVPVITQSAVSVDNPSAPIVNSVQYRDTGILLTVTPRVNDGNMVVLEVSQEVSNAIATSTSGIDAPTIQQRRFDSVVTIADGDTLAMGGLIRSTRTVGETGIPLLKDVPLLGNAFKTNSDNRDRTELVIFLRPVVIRSQSDARDATRSIQNRLDRLRIDGFGDNE